MKFDWALLWKAIKEPLRLLVLGIVSVLIIYIAGLDTEWSGVLLVLLRLIDSYLHELGKDMSTKKDEHFLVKGLTRF